MSRQANITFDHGWHRHEAKTLDIAVYEDDDSTPVDLNAIASIQWRLLRHGRAVLTKTKGGGITVTGPSNNVASVAIAVADYTTDVPAGSYRHELWDRTNDRLLAFGTALLQQGSAE